MEYSLLVYQKHFSSCLAETVILNMQNECCSQRILLDTSFISSDVVEQQRTKARREDNKRLQLFAYFYAASPNSKCGQKELYSLKFSGKI